MTRIEALAVMANLAGFDVALTRGGMPMLDDSLREQLEKFAVAVAKAERERCALIAVSARDGYAERSNLMACASDYIACAIRALKDEVSA